jgi:3',5'-cyclic AMP phosphodiesterase CpdA
MLAKSIQLQREVNHLKFAVFTDLHYDVIHDGDRRIQEFIDSVQRENVDFIIELGDLCNPTKKNQQILDRLRGTGIPCYFQLGNHNADYYPLDVTLKFFDIDKGYYSFVFENIKFIILDANYIKTPTGYIPFNMRNYHGCINGCPFIPPEEMEWLSKELADEQYHYVILSHQSLSNDFKQRGIANREEVRAILEQNNHRSNNVLLCMNGHDHGDDVKIINGIYYYTVNSMSYIWHGMKETFYYGDEIHKQYPYLKDLILYEEPLHVIVTIDENAHISINGMEGHYQNTTPKDVGIGNTFNGVSIKPRTSSIYIGDQLNP